MIKKQPRSAADYIVPLDINGLEGRMLHLPAPKGKNREVLFIYGHHSSLERWWGIAEFMNRYGAVTMPDLPGFGGMDSFYKIGKKPSIDNMADYLAAFVKMRYKRKQVVIVGMSLGFVIATRMLQRYPELTKRVSLLVSIVGFAHYDDFLFSRTRRLFYVSLGKFFSRRLPALFFRYFCLSPWVLRPIYARLHNAKHKFKDAKSAEEHSKMMDVEIGLWHDNDVRTYMYSSAEFLRLDNCGKRVELPVWHVAAKNDHFFNNHLVEQHMRVIFKDFHTETIALTNHAPSVLAKAKDVAPFIPPKLRRILAKS